MSTSILTPPASDSTDTVLAGLVRHVANAAAASQLPIDTLLPLAGITPGLLTDPNGRLPVLLLERLVCAAVAISGDELLGLHMSQVAVPAGFGVTGYIRQACSTLQQVIEMTMRYERLVSDIGTTSLLHRPGTALWCWDCKTDNPEFRRQATEYLLGCWVSIQLRLVGPQSALPILAVHFRHAPPTRPGLLAEYQQLFGCPCHFNQPESGLVLAASALGLPLSHPDMALQETLEQHARQLLSQRRTGPSIVDQVRAQLVHLLHQGHASRERLAENLGVSSRQLHRQLEAAGSSYRQLLDEIRLELARDSLRDTATTIEAVGLRLCFSESQSFIRWFRGMAGVTPAEFRRQQASGT
jgi:AraC-like DNA-binding protein